MLARPRTFAPLLAALALALALVPGIGAAAQTAQGRPLPLGAPGLFETRETTQLAPGVEHVRIRRGTASIGQRWTVDVGFVASVESATALAAQLRTDLYRPLIRRVNERPMDDPLAPLGGALGYLVRVGAFRTETDALALRAELLADGYRPRVVNTAEDGRRTTGPWVVNVLRVDPELFEGDLRPVLANEAIVERETLTAIAARTGALAAINGGYFVIGEADGTPGDLAGVSMIDGELLSEAVAGRTSLVLDDVEADVIAVDTVLTAVTATGTYPVDGRNREPGQIRACGGFDDLLAGELVETPLHDLTCTDDSELIQYLPRFGAATPAVAGVEAVLDETDTVVALRAPGGPVPTAGSVLVGTGEAADWLTANAVPGERIQVDVDVFADGQALPPDDGLGIVNGGPRLLRDGQAEIPAQEEGFDHPGNPEFFYRFGVRRNPRTLAGVTSDGDLLLVTVEGRRPGYSVGASFAESAGILQALGADDGVNLDGGGSTGMTLGGRLVTVPSDTTGERPIGDAIVITSGSAS